MRLSNRIYKEQFSKKFLKLCFKKVNKQDHADTDTSPKSLIESKNENQSYNIDMPTLPLNLKARESSLFNQKVETITHQIIDLQG